MTTIYRKKGAVHGFSIEYYRAGDGKVEYCDLGGNWQPSKMSGWDLTEQVRALYFERLDWVCYHGCGGYWRIAGPFMQTIDDNGNWVTETCPHDVTRNIELGFVTPI